MSDETKEHTNVISLFKTPVLPTIKEMLPVGLTGTTGPTGGWFSNTEKVVQELSDALLTDPIGEMFSSFKIGIFDKINDITASALHSVEGLREALHPYSGVDLQAFFNNVQRLREQCNGLITFPSSQEAPSKNGELDKVRFLCHQKDVVEQALSGIPKKQVQPRLMVHKSYYIIRTKANVAKGQEINTRLSIDLKVVMDSLGKKTENKKSLKVEKNRLKKEFTEAIQKLDTKAIFHYHKGKLEIVLSREFLMKFKDQKTHTYIPWLLKINSEYTFRVAEKLIAHYSTLNNSQKSRPNYHRLSYNKIFREIIGDPNKVDARKRYEGYCYIKEAIDQLTGAGYIEGSWHKGNIDLKNKKPDNHEEAMDCIFQYHIPKFDLYKLSINQPLPHQKG